MWIKGCQASQLTARQKPDANKYLQNDELQFIHCENNNHRCYRVINWIMISLFNQFIYTIFMKMNRYRFIVFLIPLSIFFNSKRVRWKCVMKVATARFSCIFFVLKSSAFYVCLLLTCCCLQRPSCIVWKYSFQSPEKEASRCWTNIMDHTHETAFKKEVFVYLKYYYRYH